MTDGNESRANMWWARHAADRAVRQVSATIAVALDAIETGQRRGALERQLNALDDCQIADIGIAREQIPAIASAYPDSPQLLRRMAERVGVPPEALLRNPSLRREMEWNCVACSNRSQCRRWLRSATPADAYRSFCPNAAGLDRLSAAPTASG